MHELDPKTGKEHVVNIVADGDFPWMMPHWEDVSSELTNMTLSPTGKRAVVEARGEIFTIPAENGNVRNLTNTSGAAERNPVWSPDGKSIAYFSDKSGEFQLVDPRSGRRSSRRAFITLPHPTHYFTPAWSPDGKYILYTDTNLHLWVLDVATGEAKQVGEDPWMVPTRTMDPAWSPDSKWIAYAAHLNSLFHAMFVYNMETGQTHQVTDGMADVVSPAWDASGKYLWFLASTDFGLKSQWLDMSNYDHTENFGLYVTVLSKGDPTPFTPQSDEDHGGVGRPVVAAVVAARRSRRTRWLRRRTGRRCRRRRAAAADSRGGARGRSTCRSISTACRAASSRCRACPRRSYTHARGGGGGNGLLPGGRRAGGGARRRGAPGAGGGGDGPDHALPLEPTAGRRPS